MTPASSPGEPAATHGRWWRWTHPFATRHAARQAHLLAAHHTWTTQRARQAQIALVRAGYHLGPIPFGYRAHRVTVPDPTGTPRRRVRLVIDPPAATVVTLIYRWYLEDRLDPTAIVTRLAADPLWYPAPRPWTTTIIRRILTNPVYTGATVWGRTIAGRPAPPELWIVCPHAHEAIIDGRTFLRAQLLAPPGTGVLPPTLTPWEFPTTTSSGPVDTPRREA
ncbi:recombinase [Protofrankia sp. BMG5.30]|nr:recombinase [Protofrankia sp. BMG5.30]